MVQIAGADPVPFQIDGDLDPSAAVVDPRAGTATITGTVNCTEPGTVTVSVSMFQWAGSQFSSSHDVTATNSSTVACGDTWTVTLSPVDGRFRRGQAEVAAAYPGGAVGGEECSFDDNSPTTVVLRVAR
jgi:hypothetical protein